MSIIALNERPIGVTVITLHYDECHEGVADSNSVLGSLFGFFQCSLSFWLVDLLRSSCVAILQGHALYRAV